MNLEQSPHNDDRFAHSSIQKAAEDETEQTSGMQVPVVLVGLVALVGQYSNLEDLGKHWLDWLDSTTLIFFFNENYLDWLDNTAV